MGKMNKKIFKDLLPTNPVILDIGSYDGKDADELSRMFNCEVHCFEMDKDNCRKIQAIGNNKLRIWPYAVSNEIGEVKYIRSDNHPQSSSLRYPLMHTLVFPDVKFNEQHPAFAIKLDNWFTLISHLTCYNTIDLIWCDVNGAEANVIAGGHETLKNTRYLFIEFEQKELFEGALTREQIKAALPDFECIGEYNFEGNYGNLLFKNKNL